MTFQEVTLVQKEAVVEINTDRYTGAFPHRYINSHKWHADHWEEMHGHISRCLKHYIEKTFDFKDVVFCEKGYEVDHIVIIGEIALKDAPDKAERRGLINMYQRHHDNTLAYLKDAVMDVYKFFDYRDFWLQKDDHGQYWRDRIGIFETDLLSEHPQWRLRKDVFSFAA